jgi:hypothetical protein
MGSRGPVGAVHARSHCIGRSSASGVADRSRPMAINLKSYAMSRFVLYLRATVLLNNYSNSRPFAVARPFQRFSA